MMDTLKVRNQRKSYAKGASSAFSIMGDDLELRDNDNLRASWYNVGIYYKRAMSTIGARKGYSGRFSNEELETL